MNSRDGRPLRLRSLAVQNFRTFHDRQTIPFQPDVTVFHGDTGAGKSTALVAVDFFFAALSHVLERGDQKLKWGSPLSSQLGTRRFLTERDRPLETEATVFAATFEHDPAHWAEIHIAPVGADATLTLRWSLGGDESSRTALLNRLFPFGANSRPVAVLDSRRRPRWLDEVAGPSRLAASFAHQLYALRTSKTAADRERWRSFASVLSTFPTLAGATISIEAGATPELVVEHPGRVVLGIDELSSGEQELAALTAGVLLARAAIVAVEEPEMGLDVRTQRLWRDVCEQQRAAGFVHQFIFESHAVTFDGARVVRFRRDSDGATRVEEGIPSGDAALARTAADRGAAEVFVSKDGYTKLPGPMMDEIGTGDAGARVWFLRGRDTWEAWPEGRLEDLLAEKPDK